MKDKTKRKSEIKYSNILKMMILKLNVPIPPIMLTGLILVFISLKFNPENYIYITLDLIYIPIYYKCHRQQKKL